MAKESLSAVKELILKLLDSGEWVSSKALLQATKQKYFDRRTRELKDELGYDIELKNIAGEPHYRLASKNRSPSKVRTYLGAKEKRRLLETLSKTCSLCGKNGAVGKDLVLDHRMPLIRGGGGSTDNFQILCRECNNQKRTQCKSCTFDCQKCYLAFPEKFPRGITLRPDNSDHWIRAIQNAQKLGIDLENYLLTIIKTLK